MKKPIKWNSVKDGRLKLVRGVGFEDILRSRFIKVRHHPRDVRQSLMLYERAGYIWVVPFVESDEEIFLKTLYRSRKYTKLYKKGLL